MSIVLIFKGDASPWRELLVKKLPNEVIEIHPDVKNKDAVRFALCWKPEKDILLEYKNLEVVQSLGAGVDHILETQTLDQKTKLTRLVDTNLSHDMWEYLLVAVLQYIKNIAAYRNDQRHQTWKPQRYRTIQETHVSIMGLGKIGEYVARKFTELGFTVSGWSASRKDIAGVKSYTKEELDAFLNSTEILINVLPLTPDTKGILNKELFGKLKQHAYIISVGRGDHLVERDLLEALDAEMLSGAMLDVFAEEPLPKNHPFWNHPKITITPHVASLTNFDSAIDFIVENYRRMLSGQPLLHVVSQEKGY